MTAQGQQVISVGLQMVADTVKKVPYIDIGIKINKMVRKDNADRPGAVGLKTFCIAVDLITVLFGHGTDPLRRLPFYKTAPIQASGNR